MDLPEALRSVLVDVAGFAEHVSGVRLRSYQVEVARAVVDSVLQRRGLTFVVIFPRQSGKNELQAQIETYLLALLQSTQAEIVKVSPTWKPQSQNAMRRLERVLSKNLATRSRWVKEQGYIYRVGGARITFLSAEPSASVVGATASTLLECDEAQDVLISKWDAEINPMAASTDATRVFWGTAWTAHTLLAREKRLALAAEAGDGVRRVFERTAEAVRREVPAYGRFVDGEIARLGRSHPAVRTQYFSEEIAETLGLFSLERLRRLGGAHPAAAAPRPGAQYLFCLDVGGEAETSPRPGFTRPPLSSSEVAGEGAGVRSDGGRSRDATALTVFEVDSSALADPGLRAPIFRAVHRCQWTGLGQPELLRIIAGLAELWQPRRIVVDATGLGEGLAGFLGRAFPGRVVRFKFSQASKSDLGWKFVALVETGRYQEHAPDPSEPLQAEFLIQAAALQAEVLPGPGRVLRYGVPPGAVHPHTGAPLHDDLVISAMLCAAALDSGWGGEARSAVIQPPDPLAGLRFR